MRKRHLAILPIAAAFILGPSAAAPAFASDAASGPSAAVRQSVTVTAITKPVAKPPGTPTVQPQAVKPQPARPTGKPVTKPTTVITTFTATGTLTAVDPAASTVTVLLKGRDTRGAADTVTVAATARITLDSMAAGLAALPVGGRISVQGLSAGGVRTVTKATVTTVPAA